MVLPSCHKAPPVIGLFVLGVVGGGGGRWDGMETMPYGELVYTCTGSKGFWERPLEDRVTPVAVFLV